MKKTVVAAILVAVLLFVLLSLFGVQAFINATRYINTPPDINTAEEQFQKYYDSIEIVVSYLINSGNQDVYIKDNTGSIWADFQCVQANETVNTAIQHLFKEGYISINKSGNTIWFLQWKGTQDIGCGIAYSIDGETIPEIEFTTKLIPMSKDSWYYYVSDYNSWRVA